MTSFGAPLVNLDTLRLKKAAIPPPTTEEGCNRFELSLFVREQFFRRYSVMIVFHDSISYGF